MNPIKCVLSKQLSTTFQYIFKLSITCIFNICLFNLFKPTLPFLAGFHHIFNLFSVLLTNFQPSILNLFSTYFNLFST